LAMQAEAELPFYLRWAIQKKPRSTAPQSFLCRIPFTFTLFSLFWFSLVGSLASLNSAEARIQSVVYNFTQRLDHFNQQNSETFIQRYWEQREWWNPSPTNGGKPLVLLQITSRNQTNLLRSSTLATWAQQLEAMLIQIESRFTGQSFPQNLSTSNLRFDNTEQHIQDLVKFITNRTAVLFAPNKIEARWVLVGSLFDGAYSTWFRSRFPNLSFGSISMSPFLKATLNDTGYDQIYQQWIGSQCTATIHDVLQTLVAQWATFSPDQKKAYESTAGCPNVPFKVDNEFFYVLSNILLGSLYSTDSTASVCANLTNTQSLDPEQKINNLALLIKSQMYGSCELWDIAFDLNQQAFRSLLYLQCSQLGQFEISAASATSVIPTPVSLPWYLHVCNDLFGGSLTVPPDVDLFNNIHGGDNPPGCNMVFVTSTNDQYSPLGPDPALIAKSSPTNQVISINCPQPGLTYLLIEQPNPSDPECITDARNKVLQILQGWQNADQACATQGDGDGDGDGSQKSVTAIVGVLVGIFGILIGIVIGGLVVFYTTKYAYYKIKRVAWTKLN